MKISNNDLIKLFPHFKEPCVILTAKLSNSSKFDPEDKYAADAILKYITDIQGRDDKVKIKIFSSVGAIESDKHNILIGGWTDLTNYISYMPSYSEKIPHLDLHFYTDPTMENRKVIRKFYGEPKIKSLRAVLDERLGRDKLFYTETDPKGWLIKDYLLVTTFHLKCLIPSADDSLFITSFVGLYGPGTMAVELFFKRFDEKLKEPIFKAKRKNPCFQILCSAEKIDHSGKFSYARDIDFVRSYAVAESRKLVPKDDMAMSALPSVPQRGKQIIKKEVIEENDAKNFIVYLSNSTGSRTKILKITENEKEKFFKERDRYDIFINDRRVYVKKIDAQTKRTKLVEITKMEERVYRLLVISLKYKDESLDIRSLFRKVWADIERDRTGIPEEKVIVNDYLKTRMSRIRKLIPATIDFKLIKPRNSPFYLPGGTLKYCVIINKKEEDKFKLSDII